MNGSNVPPAVHPGEYIQPANNYYPNQGQYYHQRDCVEIHVNIAYIALWRHHMYIFTRKIIFQH